MLTGSSMNVGVCNECKWRSWTIYWKPICSKNADNTLIQNGVTFYHAHQLCGIHYWRMMSLSLLISKYPGPSLYTTQLIGSVNKQRRFFIRLILYRHIEIKICGDTDFIYT